MSVVLRNVKSFRFGVCHYCAHLALKRGEDCIFRGGERNDWRLTQNWF